VTPLAIKQQGLSAISHVAAAAAFAKQANNLFSSRT
jgi:hypothetical protein